MEWKVVLRCKMPKYQYLIQVVGTGKMSFFDEIARVSELRHSFLTKQIHSEGMCLLKAFSNEIMLFFIKFKAKK